MIRWVNRQCTLQKRKKNMRRAATFCLFMRTSPINFDLLGGNGNTLKSKTTAKLREKRISLAAVRDILWTFGTFLTSLLSRYRLPLRNHKIVQIKFFPYIFWLVDGKRRIRKSNYGSESWRSGLRIQINLICWIGIRIQIADPDPGGQKWPKK